MESRIRAFTRNLRGSRHQSIKVFCGARSRPAKPGHGEKCPSNFVRIRGGRGNSKITQDGFSDDTRDLFLLQRINCVTYFLLSYRKSFVLVKNIEIEVSEYLKLSKRSRNEIFWRHPYACMYMYAYVRIRLASFKTIINRKKFEID